jgi:predicted MPP superfamily phosphohydrolase
MPDDGASSPTARVSRPPHRGRRIRRVLWITHAATLVLHAPFVVGLGFLIGALPAFVAGVAVYAVTTSRLRHLVGEGRRSRVVTALVDVPVLAHWCAALFATVLWPLFGVVASLLVAAGWLRASGGAAVSGAALAAYAVSLVIAVYGTWLRRRWVRVVHVDIPVAGLAPTLDGYRIAQMSDLHIGNFDSKARGLEWARRVNGLEPDLVVVTGDLVTTGTAFYADVAEVLGALRARDGVFVSLGNHDQWDPDLLTRLIEAGGPVVLRNAWRSIQREGAELVVAGLDDRMARRADLERTLADRPPCAKTVLLSHYPDFFEEAARRRVDLVLSGHTHGGQIAVPFMAQRASLSTLVKQTRHGLHVRDGTRLFVNAGLGTTGPPFRLGVPPEIAVLVLRAT